jgi:hypothetical protein|tara:strand:- start:7514 stop:8014 length:501 start_codon:yes stop_codon:yes gene_type:complete
MERVHKIKNHFGMPDYYKFYKGKVDNPVDKLTYNKIITEFNNELQDLIIEENLIYQMPYTNLELVLKKEKRKPRIVDGKLINNLPINWKATNALWGKDKEAKEKKLRIRHSNSHTSGHVFRIYCKKFKCSLKARGLYKWQTVRSFARKLSKVLNDENKSIDAYLLY